MKQMFSLIFREAAVERRSTKIVVLQKSQNVQQNLKACHFTKT